MERLGFYIFYFFFLGLTFFERVRTKGETGSLWWVLLRNVGVVLFAVLGFFFIGTDLMYPDAEKKLFGTALSIINYEAPYGDVGPDHRAQLFKDIWMHCLFCAASTLIVAVGIWELKTRIWVKLFLIAVFNLLIYPVFGFLQGDEGFLGRIGFYDHAGALVIWSLPAAFVFGIRWCVPSKVLPGERKHDMKGYKILPGMKQRFFLSRGIGFTMVFLVLNATTLVGHSWVLSKTLTLIPASFTILFCNILFFGLFGRNKMARMSYAPPFFAIMGALVATQACSQYEDQQAILASVVTTFCVMLYLRVVPQKVRIWDPICAVPIFMVGGMVGALMSSLSGAARVGPQLAGVVVCILCGFGIGAILTNALRFCRCLKVVEPPMPLVVVEQLPEPPPKKRWLFWRK